MSKLDELIQELCPDGVEYKKLGEIGKFYGGITGKSKEDFKDGNSKFITYKNIYNNLSLNLDVDDTVKINENENQRTLEYGDIIFTGSSETADECGISSVLTQKTDEKLYLNSFCFFLRLNDKDILNPDFAKHLFRSSNLRYQIGKTASGVTRFNVSKKAMERVCIPVPPLEVQSEIVRILDNFTLLTAELTAELTARRKQYEYYKDILFYIDDNIEKKTFEELCYLSAGGDINKENIKKERTEEYNIPVLSNGIGKNALYGYTNISKITAPCITISGRGTIGYSELRTEDFYPIVRLICVNPKTDVIDIEYLNHYIKTIKFKVPTTGIPQLTVPMIKKYKIPIPPIEKQKRIKMILNKFDKIITDIKEGLPAEIESRQKQYKYYRDKLLTFKEKK